MRKIILAAVAMLLMQITFAQNVGIGTTSPTDQLHTTGSVRFQNYSGVGNRPVYLDSAGRMVVAPTGTLFSNNTQYAIPDNGCGTGNGITSGILVSGLATSVSTSKIAVRINITHTYDEDLEIYLYAPTGSIIRLASNVGATENNFSNTIFCDDAPTSITAGNAPFFGRYKPQGGLTASCSVTPTDSYFTYLNGGTINPNGTWRIKVFDGQANDLGTLDSWQITFEGQGAFGTGGVTGYVPYFKDGNLALSNLFFNGTNMGIGTTSPNSLLDVNGGAYVYSLGTGFFRMSGANAAGKVMTSTNANGDATWSSPAPVNTAFRVFTSGSVAVNVGNSVTIPFNNATNASGEFDDGSNFNNTLNAYVAPATGVYQFNITVGISNAGNSPATGYIQISAVGTGSTFSNNLPNAYMNLSTGSYVPPSLSLSFITRLIAGDKVKITAYNNLLGSTITAGDGQSQFTGVRLY